MKLSVRHEILHEVVETFKKLKVTTGTQADDFFGLVTFGRLTDEAFKKRYAIGVVPGQEQHSHLFPFLEGSCLTSWP